MLQLLSKFLRSFMVSPPPGPADTPAWIESRDPDLRGFFLRHPSIGYFDGSASRPTWVPPLNAALDVPPPPFVSGVTPLGPPTSSASTPAIAPAPAAMTYANISQLNQNNGLTSPPVSTGPLFPSGSLGESSSRAPSSVNITHSSSSAPSSSRGSYRSYAAGTSRQDSGSDVSSWSRPRDNYRARQHDDHRPRGMYYRPNRPDRGPRRNFGTRDRESLMLPPPDIVAAPSTHDGHPLFASPTHDYRRWGTLTSVPVHDPEWEAHELQRQREAAERVANDPRAVRHPIRPADANLVGRWHGIRIITVSHAYNFEQWLLAGCPFTWEMFRWMHRSYSGDPVAPHTEGEAFLLTNQHVYFAVHKEREERRAASDRATRSNRPLSERITDAPIAVPSTAPASTQPSSSRAVSIQHAAVQRLNEALAEATRPPSPRFEGPSYVGLSPPSPEPTDAPDPSDPPTVQNSRLRQSTRSSRETVYNHYAARPADTWPAGVRTSEGNLPTTSTASPNILDLISLNTIQALAPNVREDRDAHTHFVERCLELLSIPGYYARLVEIGGYQSDFHPLSPYPYELEMLDHCHIAAWLMLHGIVPGCVDFDALQSFAVSARRFHDPATSGMADEFEQFPRNVGDVEDMSTDEVTPWAEINFGTLRPGLPESDVPSRPSIAMVDDSQDTAMDTDDGESTVVSMTADGFSIELGHTRNMARRQRAYRVCANGIVIRWHVAFYARKHILSEAIAHLLLRDMGAVPSVFPCPGCRVSHREYVPFRSVGSLDTLVRVVRQAIRMTGQLVTPKVLLTRSV
ncbi:hypothetical protein B0H11DRAFT_2236340 [Mycena galericulata]|nr:hypothetical protein B0H11DRAFT_2236340 [Mycena galericulata]